ncbi:MAG TPA: hypothetical protein VFM94_03545 [Solirubrobacterales bacterium]|nr:hypothetical protein [Solirubrobacterales bacterium]
MEGDLADVDPVRGGQVAAQLLCSPVSWIRRRRLHISFVDDVAMRFQFSVDFRVPTGIHPSRAEDGARYVPLPLFVIRKAPSALLDFDLVDGSGRARSLPTRESNAELSSQILFACAGGVLGVPHARVGTMPGFPADQVRAIAVGEPSASAALCDALLDGDDVKGDSVREALASDGDFRFLASLVAGASIVSLPVPPGSGEQLIKLTYSEPIAEWKESWDRRIRAGFAPLTTLVELLCVGGQTFHLEADMPEGLGVAKGVVGVSTPGGVQSKDAEGRGRATHLYLPRVEQARLGAAILTLGLQRGGFMENALVACAAVAGILLTSLIAAPALASANSTVPTLMLFFPGLLATIALQPTTHALTRRMLGGARRAVLLCAILAYAAAMWLVVAPRDSTVSSRPLAGRAVPVRVGVARKGALPTPSRDAAVRADDRPAPHWLRIGWGVLAAFAVAATLSVGIAYRRALP